MLYDPICGEAQERGEENTSVDAAEEWEKGVDGTAGSYG